MISKISVWVLLAVLHGTRIIFGSIFYDQILRFRQLNQACSTDMDCTQTDFALCSTDKVCECLDHFFAFNTSHCSPLINGYCLQNNDCLIKNSICVDNKCKCKPQYTLQSYHCLRSTIGDYCRSDEDCSFIHFTKCSDHICICQENYSFVDSTCLPLLGSFCIENGPCAEPNSVCTDNKCQCVDGFIPISNHECVPDLLGQKCSRHSDCMGVKLAQCSENNTCVCKTQRTSHNRRICINVLGEDCSSDKDCAPQNSMCVNHKCRCQPHYVAISDYECFDELQLKYSGELTDF